LIWERLWTHFLPINFLNVFTNI